MQHDSTTDQSPPPRSEMVAKLMTIHTNARQLLSAKDTCLLVGQICNILIGER